MDLQALKAMAMQRMSPSAGEAGEAVPNGAFIGGNQANPADLLGMPYSPADSDIGPGAPIPGGPSNAPAPQGGIPLPNAHAELIAGMLAKAQAPMKDAAAARFSGASQKLSPEEMAAIAKRFGAGQYQVE